MIIIDGIPPSVNDYWKRSRNGGIYLTPKAKMWKQLVLLAWARLPHEEKRKVTRPIVVEVEVHFPDKRRHDLDNILKCSLDSLQGYLYDDDAMIRKLTVERGTGKPGSAKTFIRWSY